MRAQESVLRNLLQGEKQYVIPLYQRTYSWKRDQLGRLWTDITDLMHAGDGEGHFLGSIVLAPSPTTTASGIQSWLVIDGQQRITTLSILLCAIRDHYKENLPPLARKIDVQYLTNEFSDPPERYKLMPTQADREAWVALLEGKPTAGGEDILGSAYRFFRGRLETFSNSEDIQRIEQIVVGELSFVDIYAQAGDNVYRIFESLNNTGLKLTQADLLRNYIFMRLPNSADRVYREKWLPIQEILDEKQLVDLIWLDLVLKKKRATQHSIYREQQKHLDLLGGEDEVESWVGELYRLALVFKRILDPEKETDPTIRHALDRLQRWRATVVYPAALRILLSYEEGKLEAAEVAAVLRVIESYLVRQMIVGTVRAGNNVLLSDLVTSFDDQIPDAKTVTRILTRQRGRFPTDEAVRDAMVDHPFYWRGKGWQKYFILQCLEEGFGRAERVDFKSSELSIEHILPQSLTRDWEKVLLEEIGEGESLQDVHEQVVHTIGNLTLSAYNGRLSNKRFSEKKEILASSGLVMNIRIAAKDRWGIREIRKRSEELAELAITVWPGPDDSAPVEPQSPKLAAVRQVLTEIPSGRWTNYLAVAQAAGTHRGTVSRWLAEYPLPNGHRVLRSDGSIPAVLSAGVGSPERQVELLESEGVSFGANGKAEKGQHMGFTDLVRIVEGESES
ncbi:GmrSD restriction endonuclease domain-containing protein [Streptomyces triticirhizae]|uniref:GmrSD restriction endonuclease domain-containing protein n=1 Tax=Streptomyces triticirhizae TaxID=2483353 RepID=UPI0013155518|nr:DUF262 domain-containing protein [Streptomyces triticirhizae]